MERNIKRFLRENPNLKRAYLMAKENENMTISVEREVAEPEIGYKSTRRVKKARRLGSPVPSKREQLIIQQELEDELYPGLREVREANAEFGL